MIYAQIPIITAYDMSGGDTVVAIVPESNIYANLGFQFSCFGLDDNDASATLQGTWDNYQWFDVDNVTLAQGNAYSITALPDSSHIIAATDITANVTQFLYVNGSTSNDGLKTVVGFDTLVAITYSNATGSFNVGDTITADDGDTGEIIAMTSTILYVNPTSGDFSGSSDFEDDQNSETADIDSIATITAITVSEPLTAEVAAGEIQMQSDVQLLTDNYYLNYRMSIDVGGVGFGTLYATLWAKNFSPDLEAFARQHGI